MLRSPSLPVRLLRSEGVLTAATRRHASSSSAAAAKASSKKPSSAKASASPATTAAVAPATGKPAVVRNYQVDKVRDQCTAADTIFGVQEGPAIWSFVGFQNLKHEAVAKRILAMDPAERHVHTVFGRPGVPCDLVLDLDFPLSLDSVGHKKYYSGEQVVLDAMAAIEEFYKSKKCGLTDVIILDGGSDKKHSYHIHVRSNDGVFKSYDGMREVAARVNSALPVSAVDTGVYRPNGTMRIAYTPKYTERQRLLLPIVPRDAAMKRLCKPMLEMPKEAIVARSFVVSPTAADGKKNLSIGQGASGSERDENGNIVPKHLLENKKWARYGECIAALKRLPVSAAEDYNTWVRVGMALHGFGDDVHILNEWKNFSARCRAKYNPTTNDNLWKKFGNRPNCFNWRRGFNYLMHTVRRPAGGVGGLQ